MPNQRATNVIPQKYLAYSDENAARLNFCLDIIEATKDSCCTYKPNQQYLAGFTKMDHQKLSTAIRNAGCISIFDYKLNDIGDSIDAALFHIHSWGYDAITFNPFLGNLQSTVETAHQCQPELGIIVLTLTSNVESKRYQLEATLEETLLYTTIAEDVRKYHADGCVVGATGHITPNEIKTVRTIVGDDILFLVPGVGTQQGDPAKVLRAGGDNIVINVGRDIIYADNPEAKAATYNQLFNNVRITL